MTRIMNCPEKEILQRRCTESWNALESAFRDLGIVLDPNIGDVLPRLIQGLNSVKGSVDARSGGLRPPYLEAFSLLSEHRRASSLLDQHLHRHRC
jgi:hypothetical protein